MFYGETKSKQSLLFGGLVPPLLFSFFSMLPAYQKDYSDYSNIYY
jgi:hypothetical protein